MVRKRVGHALLLLPLVLVAVEAAWQLPPGPLTESRALSCSGNGYRNPDNNDQCICIVGWHGPDCSKRRCPYGRAWADIATDTDKAHAPDVECSNMGLCDIETGECTCQKGFWGPACDRLSCPNDCNGHGTCMTISEAAAAWDGLNLVRPHVSYTKNWDAHMIYGCVCERGWEGYDCSLASCPRGDDPLTKGQHDEEMLIRCTGNNGSFIFSFRGEHSAPIPANASYGVVQERLESMRTIKEVDISMTEMAVCTSQGTDTRITFTQDFGSLPPARVNPNELELGGDLSAASVQLVTEVSLECDVCWSCRGGFYLGFEGWFTDFLAWNATPSDVQRELHNVDTLNSVASTWGNITVDVTGGTYVCDETSTMLTTITLTASYGNLPDLQIINSVYDPYNSTVQLNITSNKGTKENAPCSNHGLCDYETGTCKCFQERYNKYFWQSSDGHGNRGLRGDCGYSKVRATACPGSCSGRGVCGANFTCSCYEPYWGPDCSYRRCPGGRAWFDEASTHDKAHANGAECSNRGLCDRYAGTCKCQIGFEGAACERMSCAFDGELLMPCSGHGRCLNMYRLTDAGSTNDLVNTVTYGSLDEGYENFDATWDASMVQGCLCDLFDNRNPYSGPVGVFSGVSVNNPQLSGYMGYDCSQRSCPRGDDIVTYGGVPEVQSIGCNLTYGNFTVKFRKDTSDPIPFDATAEEVEEILRDMTTLGDVKVNISGGLAVCDSMFSGGYGVNITFLTELGDLPLITTEPQFHVVRLVKGTREDVECSNRGYCERSSGVCKCLDGFASSDGFGRLGLMGDCGAREGVPFRASTLVSTSGSGGGVS